MSHFVVAGLTIYTGDLLWRFNQGSLRSCRASPTYRKADKTR